MQVQKIVLNNVAASNSFVVEESYKSLLTNIQFCGSEVQVITVTSCLPNEGKSKTSIEISKGLANTGKKVLFIDADMRNSVIVSRYTKATTVIKGLSQLLSGQFALADALYETQYDGFYVIFSGQNPPNPVELLSGNKFKSLIKSSKEIFDYVIIDTPPLGLVIDAAVVASHSDSAMLVCSVGKSSLRLAQTVLKQLQKSGCHIIGAILNNVSKKKRKYGGYGYGKKYGKGYGKGYGKESGRGYEDNADEIKK